MISQYIKILAPWINVVKKKLALFDSMYSPNDGVKKKPADLAQQLG